MNTHAYPGARHYQDVGVGTDAASADPHRLVQMLFEGALERIAQARGAIEYGETIAKCERIGKAIAIVGGLKASLDPRKGGDVAANLRSLYDYVERRLFEANLHNDVSALNEAAGLLKEIKDGWDAIRDAAAP